MRTVWRGLVWGFGVVAMAVLLVRCGGTELEGQLLPMEEGGEETTLAIGNEGSDNTVTIGNGGVCEEPAQPWGFCTFTQGGWGSPPAGNNPGMLLSDWFDEVFPCGVTIGGWNTLTFTSAWAVSRFLPAGGRPSALKGCYVDPDSVKMTGGGVFAGQVLALTLNVHFSWAGLTGQESQDLLACVMIPDGPFAGLLVEELLALANEVLGGNLAALDAYCASISQLSDAVTQVNEWFKCDELPEKECPEKFIQ